MNLQIKCLTRRKLLFIIATLLIIVLLIEKMNELTPYLPLISTLTLIATALIILRYTIETRRLREETHKLGEQSVLQTEIQIRPLLIVTLKETVVNATLWGKGRDFIIKNVGNGIALNIETEDISIVELNGFSIKLSFDKIDVISQNEEIEMSIKVLGDNQESLSDDFVSNIEPEYAKHNYEFKLKYENINGEKYQSVVITGKDGVHLKRYGKV